MFFFRVTARQSGNRYVAVCFMMMVALLAPFRLHGESEQPVASAKLYGLVRDSRGRPLAGATVYLQISSGTQSLRSQTDSDGSYHFTAVPPGGFTLRAEMAGYSETSFGPLVLEPKEAKRIDLTLAQVSPQSSLSGSAQSDPPEFFDEPNFTVAGVTDPTNLGGHGSDTVVRNKEALAKATLSLAKTSPGSSHPESSISSAEKSLHDAVEREPGNFDAIRRLGELLVADGKAGEAIPYLERAARINPADYENAYQLALACAEAGEYEHAGANVRALLVGTGRSPQDQAKLHHLLGDVDEKEGNALEAVREYQTAAELDPSEPNLFDWGSELLLHRAAEPAIEVFAKGNRLFPRSIRTVIGLGAAWYSQGSPEQAVLRLCEASDLSPDDPAPYLFLGRIQAVEQARPDLVMEKLRRFARLQPENAMANYYYAVSLWQRRKSPVDAENVAQVKALLERAVRLDPKLGAGFFQLGILYWEQNNFSSAIPAYQRAVEVSPRLEEAHYRLAQAYRQTGETSKARSELRLYSQLSKERSEEVERDRHEIQQFVYKLRDRTPGSQPQ